MYILYVDFFGIIQFFKAAHFGQYLLKSGLPIASAKHATKKIWVIFLHPFFCFCFFFSFSKIILPIADFFQSSLELGKIKNGSCFIGKLKSECICLCIINKNISNNS